MTDSSDISRLFKHIGASEADYQEINKQDGARESKSRWPLLNSLHAQANRAPHVDTRKRYDLSVESAEVEPVESPADDALFAHIATDDAVHAHEENSTSTALPSEVDLQATHAAMAAVDAAPVQEAPAPRDTPHKAAEFIAPRAGLLGGYVRPSAHRNPLVAPLDGEARPAPVPLASLSAAPVMSGAVRRDPAPVMSASIKRDAAPVPAPAPARADALAPAPISGLFERLASPHASSADSPSQPVAPGAPASLFDRLKRS